MALDFIRKGPGDPYNRFLEQYSSGDGGFGPKVPAGSPTALQGASMGIEGLTQMVNEINQRAQQAANAGRIPGGGALESQSSANIASALAGEVDPSTLNLLGQQAAERGVATGSPMGPGSNADYLRALGLTSLDRLNTGQNWLSAATARNPAAPIYEAGNQVLTAAQVQQAILAREEMANRLRMAQLGGRGGSFGTPSRSPNVGIASAASNWVNPIKPATSGGWSFPTGYDSIPVGGTPVTGGVTDEQFADFWFPEDTVTPTAPYMDPNYAGDYSDYFDVNYGD